MKKSMNFLATKIRIKFLIALDKLHLYKFPYTKVDRRQIEDAVERYTAAQKVIDSMEPTEAEKKLDEKIDEYLDNESRKSISSS